MMNQRLPYLLDRYLNKSCAGSELAEFYALVNDPANEMEFDDLLSDAVSNTDATYELSRDRRPVVLQQIFKSEKEGWRAALPFLKKKKWGRQKLTTVAAILLMVVGVGLYFFNVEYPFDQVDNHPAVAQHHAILPGGNSAVLTLGNGTVINLRHAENGKLADEGNVQVTKNKNGELLYRVNPEADKNKINRFAINTLTTPRGGQYQLNLPDGSKVWLNAASTLKFPSTFAGLSQRKVELSGEAYFEIAKMVIKDKSAQSKGVRLPFVVVTGNQRVEVLGTHFNINAYADEVSTRTTLLEGAVKVTAMDNRHAVTLKPGQESVLNTDALVVQQADLQKSIDWKNGKFIFKNESLESIMRKVARWYDVEVVYAGRVPKQETFSGTVSRFDDVGKVLRRLELTGEVTFKINGRKITVLK